MFSSVDARDCSAWATYFLAGGRPRQLVTPRLLRQFAVERAAIDDWLFEESYQAVGDLAETIAHILPPPSTHSTMGLALWIEERLIPLRAMPPDLVRERVLGYWDELDWSGRFLMAKLIGGGFRVGVSRLLVTRALAEVGSIDAKLVAQRLVGYTHLAMGPDAVAFPRMMIAPIDGVEANLGHPYPFFLAHQLNGEVDRLGSVDDWLVEWKWDGIRAQLVRRDGRCWIWSRGEELVTDRFPELAAVAALLPDGTVLDGEIVVWKDGATRPFAELQTRIGRKTLSAKVLGAAPVIMFTYDILEYEGIDLRTVEQTGRRAQLAAVVTSLDDPRLRLSPLVSAASWAAYAELREESRSRGVEGFMLKRRDAQYGVGRTKDVGTWWKWKVNPMTIDAALVYAQRGHGRRASLYSDYTFAVWSTSPDGRQLVPFAKAYSGLTDHEIAKVDAVVRKTTVEKFGPVRSVTPTQVFEIGFEAIQRSPRHKSGIAVRFPRILRWRTDKSIDDADTLDTLKALLGTSGAAPE